MSLIRIDPWGDMLSLREAMNRLVEDSFVRPAIGGSGNLALDIWQDENNIEVTATLPGIDPDDVNITVQGDVLVIRAEQKQETARKRGNYVVRERRSGSLYRAVQLPVLVDPDKANAEFHNGVLYLSLPKAESVKPRLIRVQNGDTINTQARLAAQNDAASVSVESAENNGENVANVQ